MNTVTDVEHIPAMEPSPKKAPSGPFWITRDKRGGVLSDKVTVWVVKPDLERFDDGDVIWLPPVNSVDREPTFHCEWTLERCRKEAYTIPETERECLRCG